MRDYVCEVGICEVRFTRFGFVVLKKAILIYGDACD